MTKRKTYALQRSATLTPPTTRKYQTGIYSQNLESGGVWPPAPDKHDNYSFHRANSRARNSTANGFPDEEGFKSRYRTEEQPASCRTVLIGGRPPPNLEVLLPQKFPDNRVVTAKYTIFSFLPKNLFEQFRRAANLYFLIIAVIQLIIDSPVSPTTSLVPLCFVVGVTALKQAYEDWLRHKADNDVNKRPAYVIKQGKISKERSMDIKVGDIVFVRSEEGFPCDLVLLSSSQRDGECHITTANLDGETNLKIHYSVGDTCNMQTPDLLSSVNGVVECEEPTPDLYKFIGKITVHKPNGDQIVSPLGPESLLLRGARLKNTNFIYGVAVYTGQQTKMALNSRLTSNKFSTIERTMNIFLVVFLFIMLLEISVCTLLMYLNSPDTWWYLPGHERSVKPRGVVETLLSFLMIFNYIIPISMYVTIEMQKFIGSLFFVWDLDLYDPETDQCAKCSSSDLNEELGQVEYLFTDKTGTLTENDMRFRQCSVNGKRYMEHEGALCRVPQLTRDDPHPIHHMPEDVELFLMTLALCHTVQVNNAIPEGIFTNGHLMNYPFEYQASSPDEKALVEACSRFGVTFAGVSDGKYEVYINGQVRSYKHLQTLDFTSERKCMSVVVEDSRGNIFLLCKGAETSFLNKVVSGPVNETMQHVNDYAMLGLRTLVVAYKKMSHEDYKKSSTDLLNARLAMTDRERKVKEMSDAMEKGLHILGAVGVEDRLQDGVPETLEKLRIAGINVWVLTGDKMETAVNISVSCGHFKRCMTQLRLINQRTVRECYNNLKEIKKNIAGDPMQSYGLVIDGVSLAFALDETCQQRLVNVATQCQAVVCCRMSPLQKAEVVKLIKNRALNKPVTAAIGDGANDCSMIQEAHVGLAIMGKEGRQAVRCSDFAFARFKFLQKVFLVHGHYYYVRVATLVQYSFYKNIAFITPQVFFVLFNGYSSQTLYDSAYLMLYNIIFTSLPILIYGLFEQNIKPQILLENPDLYRVITRNARLTALQFSRWIVSGFWHAFVFFFSVSLLFSYGALDSSGRMLGNWVFGTFIFHLAVTVVNLRLLLESHYITWLFFGSIVFSLACLVVFSIVYSVVNWSVLFSSMTHAMYWSYLFILTTPAMWMLVFVVIVAALLPDVISIVLSNHYAQLVRGWRQVFTPAYRQRPRIFFLFSKRSGNLTISQTNMIDS